jgi:hypothetical protein
VTKKPAPSFTNLPKLRRTRVQVVLWGSPLWPTYRMLFREMEVFAHDVQIIMQHRHHGLAENDDGEHHCAEIIEACESPPVRRRAVLWFVAHGRAGLGLAAEALAGELKVDPLQLAGALASGVPLEQVQRDRDEALASGFPPGLVAVVNGMPFTGPLDAVAILTAALERIADP